MSLSSPLSGLLGGSIIGLSATTLLLGNGDILGCSGIVNSVILNPIDVIRDPKKNWKIVLLSSFCLTANVYVNMIGDREAISESLSQTMPALSDVGFAIGGFLVGLGTKLGNGCTSGHGICGLARLSKRSFAAVCTFMATGLFTASMLPKDNQILYTNERYESFYPSESTKQVNLAVNMALAFATLCLFRKRTSEKASTSAKGHKQDQDGQAKTTTTSTMKKGLIAAIAGSLFGLGLEVSGMTKAHKIAGFLDLRGLSNGMWDWTLVCVMGGGLFVSALGYQMVKGYNLVEHKYTLSCPMMSPNDSSEDEVGGGFNIPTNKIVDAQLIVGAALFGMGWAIGRLCPGPALCLAASGHLDVIIRWWPGYFFGALLGDLAKRHL